MAEQRKEHDYWAANYPQVCKVLHRALEDFLGAPWTVEDVHHGLAQVAVESYRPTDDEVIAEFTERHVTGE